MNPEMQEIEENEMLKPEIINDRGFRRLPNLTCTYNSTIEVRESSAMEEPHVWLDIEVDTSVLRDCEPGRAVAHLNFAQVETLILQLAWMLENHYQVVEETEG